MSVDGGKVQIRKTMHFIFRIVKENGLFVSSQPLDTVRNIGTYIRLHNNYANEMNAWFISVAISYADVKP